MTGIEAEIMFLQADVAAGCPVPLRMPPGYSRSHAQGDPSINMRVAYAAHSDVSAPNPFRCGGGCGAAGRPGDRCGSSIGR